MSENEKTIYDCDVSSSLNDLNEKVSNFKSIADSVADSYTHVLDDIMRDIKNQIVDVEEPSTRVIERYFLELTNALYFIGSNAENADIYTTLSKLSQKESYSKSYLENALPGYNDKSLKRTAAELDCIATIESVEETALAAICKSTESIVNTKIESAKEMVRTLSKMLSVRSSDSQLLGITGSGKQILNESISEPFREVM